jgi:hypothetical protein
MPNYNQAHAFYAGVDRHARSMFVRFSTLAAKLIQVGWGVRRSSRAAHVSKRCGLAAY